MKAKIELRMIHHSVIGSSIATDWSGKPPSTETNAEATADEPARAASERAPRGAHPGDTLMRE